MIDYSDHRADRRLQEARQMRLIQFRLLQLQHTYDQLGAGIEELAVLGCEMVVSRAATPAQNVSFNPPSGHANPTPADVPLDAIEHLKDAFSGRRILLAEDSLLQRAIATALLERLGSVVDAVTNGQEAVAAVAQSRYDLVLMDCYMPEMDGYEAAAAIRSLEAPRASTQRRRLPIVALTASTSEENRRQCLAAGMDDIIPKPYRAEAFIHTLVHWLPPGRA